MVGNWRDKTHPDMSDVGYHIMEAAQCLMAMERAWGNEFGSERLEWWGEQKNDLFKKWQYLTDVRNWPGEN